MFAFGLPGGVRDAEPVEPDFRAEAGPAGHAPAVVPPGRKPVDLDAIVLELKAAAGVFAAPEPGASDVEERGPELGADEADLGSVTLPRIAGASAKAESGRRLPMAALASILVHSVAFAMALHVAEIIPEAPAEEGGAVVSVVMLGNGDVDAAASGVENAEPIQVEAETVPVGQATASEPEALRPAVTEPPPEASPAEQAPPVETLAAPRPVAEQALAPPVETAASLPVEPTESAPAAALSSPLPDVLAVAPSEAASPDQAPAAAPVLSEQAPPPEAEAAEAVEIAQAAMPEAADAPPPEASALTPPQQETLPLAAQAPETETITAQEDDPDLAYDIAPPIPEPSPWQSEPLPEDQVATRQAEAERARERTRTVERQSSGSGGQSTNDARRGSVSGTSERGASQAADARSGASGNGAAAMANYAGKVRARLARAVSSERYYRGLGPLTATVVVRVSLDRSGNITSLSLARSSGNAKVDAVVLQRARAAGSFGPFPASYSGSGKSFSLPINLTLRR